MINPSTEKLPRYSIKSVTPTICTITGTDLPDGCDCGHIDVVVKTVKALFGRTVAERILIYAPDAVGDHLRPDHLQEFARINAILPIEVPMVSVIPPKTPVAFASMFTGMSPEFHGITKYEKHVLTCDTLFDAVLRSGLKTAIVAVENSSIDILFRNRNFDFFSEKDDSCVISRALELIKRNEHNLIVAYNQDYDDALHATTPFSEVALDAFESHVKSLEILHRETELAWSEYRRIIAMTPDHGAHLQPETGRGDHSLDIPEDMHITHYFFVGNPDSPEK